MSKIKSFSAEGAAAGEIDFADELLTLDKGDQAVKDVVVATLAARRAGSASTLGKGEVSGTNRKPWKQKGTGRARQGSTRSPQFTHGGVVFAPKPRDYTQQINRKVRRLALKCALSSKVADSELIVFNALNIEAPKTKEMVKVLKAVEAEKALIVLSEKDETVIRAAANIPDVATTLVGTLNTYDVLKYQKLILTKDSVAKIEEVYA